MKTWNLRRSKKIWNSYFIDALFIEPFHLHRGHEFYFHFANLPSSSKPTCFKITSFDWAITLQSLPCAACKALPTLSSFLFGDRSFSLRFPCTFEFLARSFAKVVIEYSTVIKISFYSKVFALVKLWHLGALRSCLDEKKKKNCSKTMLVPPPEELWHSTHGGAEVRIILNSSPNINAALSQIFPHL